MAADETALIWGLDTFFGVIVVMGTLLVWCHPGNIKKPLAGQVCAHGTAGITAQTQKVLAMIDALLARAGGDKSKILMAEIFIADMADVPAMSAV
jgi:hypothetical protein